jgi:RNA polymerase sigma factor (sigma-70 family)
MTALVEEPHRPGPIASTADIYRVRGAGRPEKETMQRLQFDDMFGRYADRVYSHCLRRTASVADAEDATAVVFLEAWRHQASVPVGDELPWLLGIANNVLRNHWRSRRRFEAAVGRFHAALPAGDPADRVAEQVDAEREIRRLRPMLDRLPLRELEVLELCVGSNLSPAQAAKALGLPHGTVKSRLARGLRRLRESNPALMAAQQPSIPREG